MTDTPRKTAIDNARLDRIVADAQRSRVEREAGYRAQALKLYPWVCGRCGREFSGKSLSELTVHHRNHDHDHNPPDGSNWELLCLYCHDNEHSRYIDDTGGGAAGEAKADVATSNPFAALKALMGKRGSGD